MAVSDEVRIRILTDVAKAHKDLISFGATVGGLYVAFKKAAAIVSDLTQEYFKQEQAEAKLGAVIRSTGGAAGYTAKQMSDMATQMQRTTVFEDDVVMSGQAVMATFTKIGKQVFPEAIQAAADMSTIMGQDLQASVVQIGKALNDPIAGVTALRKVGVQLTEQQREQIKAFMAQGDVMAAQKVILGELQTEFGGAAKAMGDTTYGSVVKLTSAFGELKAALGGTIAGGSGGFISNLADIVNQLALRIDVKSLPEGLEKTTAQIEILRLEAKRLEQQAGQFPEGSLMDILSRGPALRRQIAGIEKDLEPLVRLQNQQVRTATAAERERAKAIEETAAAREKELKYEEDMARLHDAYANTPEGKRAGEIEALKEQITYFESFVGLSAQNRAEQESIVKALRAELEELTKVEAVERVILNADTVRLNMQQHMARWAAQEYEHNSASAEVTYVKVNRYAMLNTHAAMLARITKEERDLLTQSAEVTERQVEATVDMTKAWGEATSLMRLGSTILDGDFMDSLKSIVSMMGPAGQFAAALMDTIEQAFDFSGSPYGDSLADGIQSVFADAILNDDWTNVKDALLEQMKKTIIQAALESGMLQPQIDTFVRVMDRYMRNPSDTNRDRLQEAFDILMEQSGNVSDVIQDMFDDLPQMARGGIVTRPTVALIGEAGPEAVVPLGAGGSAGSTYVFNAPVMSWRDFDRAAAAGVARRSRGY